MRAKFVVARDLGITIAELHARMTQRELMQWIAFYHLEALEQQDRMEEARGGQ